MISDDVLEVWFEGVDGDAVPPATEKRWFARDETFDAMLRARFGGALESAARGELGAWCATPRGALAFIVLCDQLSRNCHRGSALAFSWDALALNTALAGIARGDHRTLPTQLRLFFLMPLMHSESLAIHDLMVAELATVIEDAPPAALDRARQTLEYEHKHRVIVARFGRYPHRNEALGRASTPEEIAFLREPGSSF